MPPEEKSLHASKEPKFSMVADEMKLQAEDHHRTPENTALAGEKCLSLIFVRDIRGDFPSNFNRSG